MLVRVQVSSDLLNFNNNLKMLYILLLIGIWVVVKVNRGSTQTIYQTNSERKATNYMVKTIRDNDGKVMKHIREENGQTWEVKTPDGETSYYTTINTEDDNL